MNIFPRKYLIFLVAVVGFFVILNFFIDNPYTHHLVRAVINEKLETSTNVDLDFRAIDIQVFPPAMELYGVVVTPKGNDKERLISAEHSRFRLSLWSIFWGQTRLATADLTGVDIDYEKVIDYKWVADLPASQKKEPLKWPPDFLSPVEQISVRGTRFNYKKTLEDGQIMNVSLNDINFTIDLERWSYLNLEINVGSMGFSVGEKVFLNSAKFKGNVNLVGRQILAEELNLIADNIVIKGNTQGQLQKVGENNFSAVDTVGKFSVDGDFGLLGKLLDIANTGGKVNGEVTVDLTLPLNGSDFEFNFSLTGAGKVDKAYLYGFQLFDSEAEFSINEDEVRFEDINLIKDDQNIGEASGSIGFEKAVDFGFKVTPNQLPLKVLLQALKVDFNIFDTVLDQGSVSVKGKGRPFRIDISGNPNVLKTKVPFAAIPRPSKGARCQSKIDLNVNKVRVNFGETNLICQNKGNDTAKTTLEARGDLFFDENKGVDLQVRAEEFDLDLLSPYINHEVSGSGPLNLGVVGPYRNVQLPIILNASSVKFRKMDLGNVRTNFTVNASGLDFDRLESVMEEGGRINISEAKIKFKNLETQAKLRISSVPPKLSRQLFSSFSPMPLSFGIKDLRANIKGSLPYLFYYEGNIKAQITEFVFKEQTIFDRSELNVESTQSGWRISDATFQRKGLTLTSDIGHKRISKSITRSLFGFNPDDKLTISFNTINRSEQGPSGQYLQELAFLGPVSTLGGVDGKVNATGKLQGTFRSLNGTLEGAFFDLKFGGAPYKPFNFKTFVDGGKLDTVFDDSAGTLNGRFNIEIFKKNLPYNWYLTMKGFDLRGLTPERFYLDKRNFVRVDGDWQLAGELADWWRSKGTLNIESLKLLMQPGASQQSKKFELRTKEPFSIAMSPNGWRVSRGKHISFDGDYGELTITPTDLSPPESLGLSLYSQVRLDVLKHLFSQIDSASGSVLLKGKLSGSLSDPEFDFSLSDVKRSPYTVNTWQPLSLGIVDLRPAFQSIKFQATVKDNKLFIERFSANKGKGNLSASGYIGLDPAGSSDTQLTLNFDKATVIYPVPVFKSLDSQVSGTIGLSGTAYPLDLRGSILVDQALMGRDINLQNELVNALRESSYGAEDETRDPLFNLDVDVTSEKSIVIKNKSLQSVLSSLIKVRGTDVNPEVTGQLEVEKGKFVYRRDFDITRGVITFDEPTRIDPSLDISAIAEVSNYRIFALVTGRASQPIIELSVDPANREDGTPINKFDILVLLLRGSLPSQDQVTSQNENLATAEALNIIAGQTIDPFVKLLEQSGQDFVKEIYFDAYSAEETGAVVGRLNVPINIAGDWNVVVRVGNDKNWDVHSEYPLNESISVSTTAKGFAGDENEVQTESETLEPDVSFDLKFKFSFP